MQTFKQSQLPQSFKSSSSSYFYKQFPRDFIRPYGLSTGTITDASIQSSLKPYTCEFLKRPGTAVSEFAQTINDNLTRLQTHMPRLLQPHLIQKYLSGLGVLHEECKHLDQTASSFNPANIDNPLINLFHIINNTFPPMDEQFGTLAEAFMNIGASMYAIGIWMRVFKFVLSNLGICKDASLKDKHNRMNAAFRAYLDKHSSHNNSEIPLKDYFDIALSELKTPQKAGKANDPLDNSQYDQFHAPHSGHHSHHDTQRTPPQVTPFPSPQAPPSFSRIQRKPFSPSHLSSQLPQTHASFIPSPHVSSGIQPPQLSSFPSPHVSSVITRPHLSGFPSPHVSSHISQSHVSSNPSPQLSSKIPLPQLTAFPSPHISSHNPPQHVSSFHPVHLSPKLSTSPPLHQRSFSRAHTSPHISSSKLSLLSTVSPQVKSSSKAAYIASPIPTYDFTNHSFTKPLSISTSPYHSPMQPISPISSISSTVESRKVSHKPESTFYSPWKDISQCEKEGTLSTGKKSSKDYVKSSSMESKKKDNLMTAEQSLQRLHKSYDSDMSSTVDEEERQSDQHMSNREKKRKLKEKRKLQLNKTQKKNTHQK